MNPRLTRGEYWLLAQAVHCSFPLRVLTLPEGPPWTGGTIQENLNVEGHGMDTATLARCLMRMSRRGWIRLDRGIRESDGALPCDVASIRAAVSERGRFCEGAYYRLTVEGGLVWELFARPNWSAYIEDTESGDGVREVIVANRKSLGRYMCAVRNEGLVDEGSESIDEISDWNMAYWKQPVSGIRWRFRFQESRERLHRMTSSGALRNLWCRWF
jgi:hypothetical protein